MNVHVCFGSNQPRGEKEREKRKREKEKKGEKRREKKVRQKNVLSAFVFGSRTPPI